MYLLFSKSLYKEGENFWYDDYISVVLENDEQILCKEVDFVSWSRQLGEFTHSHSFIVEQKDEDNFIVREKSAELVETT